LSGRGNAKSGKIHLRRGFVNATAKATVTAGKALVRWEREHLLLPLPAADLSESAASRPLQMGRCWRCWRELVYPANALITGVGWHEATGARMAKSK